jgi:hypothetical protein
LATGLVITVNGPATTEPWGSITIGPITVTGTITPVVLGPTIASGANTIAVPTGSSGFVFCPPSTNTFTLQLKGVSGDTGLSMPKATNSVYFFDTGNVPANFVITAGGSVGISEVVFF